MSAWWGAVPHIAAAVAVLFVPGALLLLAAGAPWRRALAYAPAPSVGIVGVGAVGLSLAGLPFRLPGVGIALVAASVVLGLVVRLGARAWGGGVGEPRDPDPDPDPTGARRGPGPGAFVGALALAATILGAQLAWALGGPDKISQTFDAVFHLNTSRYIVESGEGSSLRLLGWGTDSGGFYPAAWHDLVALIAVDGDVVAATQALGLVVGAVVWPLAVLCLVQRLFGRRWIVLFGTAAVTAGVGIFPARMLDYGVLYPFLLGIALMPALVALTHALLRGGETRGALRGLPLLVAGGLGVAGLALAHPGVLLAFLMVVFPLAVGWAAGLARARWIGGRRVSTALVAAVVLVAGLAAVVVLDRSALVALMRGTDWRAAATPSQAVGAWLLASPHHFVIPWTYAALTLLGAVVALRRPGLRWLVAAHALLAVPYVFAAGVDSDLSQRVTGFWYNDAIRLGALHPVTGLPLVALALVWLTRRAMAADTAAFRARFRSALGNRALPVAVGVGTVVLVVITSGASSAGNYLAMANRYTVHDVPRTGTLLTSDERTLLERLDEVLPPGTVVAANPWDGSGLAYAISGVEVLVPQLGARPSGAAQVVAEGLVDAAEDPAVCSALTELGITHALDFGQPFWRDFRAQSYPGLRGLYAAPGFELVDSEGRARVYEVTACENPR